MKQVASDEARRWVTVLAYVGTITVNLAANSLPINGQSTAEISDRFDVMVIPAGYVFSIWGLIYLLLGAFTIDQARPSRVADPTLRRLGWLPAVTGLLNVTWLLLFQYEVFVLTVPVMVGLLVTLIWIATVTFGDRHRLVGASRWTVRLPFSVYLGWITVATIANIAQTLDSLGFDAFGIEPPQAAAAMLLLGLAFAITYTWRFADVAFGLVIVWAYVGIAVKEIATPLVSITAAGGSLIVAALVVIVALRGRAPVTERVLGARSTDDEPRRPRPV